MSNRKETTTKTSKPWLFSVLLYSTLIFLGFAISDLVILSFRSYFLPKEVARVTPRRPPNSPVMSRDFFQPIIVRNGFSSMGEIPPELLPKGVEKIQKDNDPVPSNLPLNLIGTLVHSNPAKSIAAIELKSKNQITSFAQGKEIDGLAKIEKIERGKVILRNLSADRLEYIEMKEANKVTFDTKPKAGTGDGKDQIIQKSGDNKFELKRSDLEDKLKDIQSILMQARAVPAKRPGSGETYGFRLLEIQPDSIYTQLGLQVMDVITGVNGTPVTTQQQALEMYQTLRNSSQIKITVERGGKNEELAYTVK
jgi:general secretion pathway protein C